MVCTTVLLGRVHSRECIPQQVVPKLSHVYRENKRLFPFVSQPSHSSQRRIFWTVKSALSSQEKQLKALDSYFQKLYDSKGVSSSNEIEKLTGKNHRFKAEKALRSLKDFRGKENGGAESKFHTFSASDDNTFEEASYLSMKMINRGGRAKKLKQYMKLKAKDIEISNKESSSFYLIGILASINIAVFLFETASPVRNSEIGMFSLPMVYGAKINHLILLGEWWRLLTPMFLHSGVLHVTLGCWVLLCFGPQVCKAYGSFSFFLIYVLGGISDNLISFLHTPEPTVGGTGPGFALIGAWLIYQVRNKDMLGKEDPKSMIDKAIMATAFSFVLSYFGPIDDWAHFGAALMGIAYGYLICPILQVDNIASTESGQKEGMTLVKQYSDPFYLIVLGLAGWSLDKYIDGEQNHPHLGGNPSTSFMLMFALIGGVMGASSMLAGFFHLRKWTSQSLATAASSAIISWAIAALAFGLVCKQIIMGGHRGKRLQTLEALITIAMVSQLLYILLLHAGIFRSRYGPVYGSYGPQH